MTKQEKIDILRKMMKLNFKMNFNNPYTYGLCTILEKATGFRYHGLSETIPELEKYRDLEIAWWWTTNGRFIPWWKRHWAIWRTIRDIKKQ